MSRTVNKNAAKLKVGDQVSFLFGSKRVHADVIEDRGPLGVGGRRIYRVSLPVAPGETMSFEMPEDELTPVAQPARAPLA